MPALWQRRPVPTPIRAAHGGKCWRQFRSPGIILSFFNSGAMVRYAGGLADSIAGEQIILAAEDWHSLMAENRFTLVVEQIRDAVSYARYSQWPDLASTFTLAPAYRAPARDTVTPVDRRIEDDAPGRGRAGDRAEAADRSCHARGDTVIAAGNLDHDRLR